MRLVRAAALVLVGVAVHLWIDGPQPALVIGGSPAQSGTGRSLRTTASRTRLAERRAPSQPALMVESDLSPLPVDSPRSIATSGRAVAALDRSLGPADRPRRAEYRRIVDTPGIPVEVVQAGGPDLPAAEVPVLHSAPKLAGWTGGAASVSPLSVPDLDFAATRKASNPLESSPPTAVAPAVRTVAVAPVPRDEDSILEVLREYETAVGRKDPLAAKAVWPALDDRALARAFNDLQSHSLALEDCGVTVATRERRKRDGARASLPICPRSAAASRSARATSGRSTSPRPAATGRSNRRRFDSAPRVMRTAILADVEQALLADERRSLVGAARRARPPRRTGRQHCRARAVDRAARRAVPRRHRRRVQLGQERVHQRPARRACAEGRRHADDGAGQPAAVRGRSRAARAQPAPPRHQRPCRPPARDPHRRHARHQRGHPRARGDHRGVRARGPTSCCS